MSSKALDVLISGERAGLLMQDSSGALTFEYLRDYRGAPLSSAMPLSTRIYRNKTVLPYLWGLLPEDAEARKRVALDVAISPNNPFALLSVIGLDCPGAVQFCGREGEPPRKEVLVSMSEGEIAHRLHEGRAGASGWTLDNEHWSLGGQQNKFALRLKGGKWYSCEGSAATTHIFKSGVEGLKHQALNEYVCMRIAANLGIPSAGVEYMEFSGGDDSEAAIVIERYDRLVSDGHVTRLHQEDLCQALGCLPENKYAMYGGPSCSDVLKLLASTGQTAQINVVHFLQMLFFNYLMAATDGHAKNYSIMLRADGGRELAPMYDVASIAPYVKPREWEVNPPKLAMSIGGENRAGRVSCNNVEKLVESCGLSRFGITADGCCDLLVGYAESIPGQMADVFDSLEDTAVAKDALELRVHMEDPIRSLCERSKKRLEC